MIIKGGVVAWANVSYIILHQRTQDANSVQCASQIGDANAVGSVKS